MPNLNRHPTADKPRISVGLVRGGTNSYLGAGLSNEMGESMSTTKWAS